MNDMKLAHPTHDRLAAFGLGQLDEAESAAIESHLADCAACRAALEAVPEDPFVAKLRSSAQPDTPAPKSQLAHEAPTLLNASAATPTCPDLPTELAQHPRYRVLQLLGAGGMGVVYKAEHQLMERPVALKVIGHNLVGDPATIERFRREVKSAARLTHPNIVAAYDAEQAGDTHFLVMEFVEGTSLDRLVAEKGRLPVAQACDYVRQAALGLQHASQRGMVHRDIKPANLMRTPEGQIKILDFGLARFARETAPAASLPPAKTAGDMPDRGAGTGNPATALTATGTVMGTPDYMAPEQATDPHAADIRADIYSLGCTLYYLLAGAVPYPEGTVVDKLLAHVERSPKPLTELRGDVPLELTRIIGRMLAKDPAQRYQTPAEVAQALVPWAGPNAARPVVPEAPAEEPVAPPGRPRGPWGKAAIVTGACGAAGLLLALVLFAQREHMETLYTICALVGGTLLVCQFLLSLVGAGGHHDFGGHDLHEFGGHDVHAGADHEAAHEEAASWFTSALTFRTLVAALTIFGLAGRAAIAAELDTAPSFGLALGAAAGTLFLVAWLMQSLYRLKADGTLRIHRAVGQGGTVYLPIPANRAGLGKVQLNVQNRTAEYQAVTAGEALATGTKVTVVAVVSSDTVEVISAPTSERITHV
jgi:hypothetical protein